MNPSTRNSTIVLTQPRGLLVRNCPDKTLELPQVPVSSDERIAYEITEYLRNEWRLKAICLFAPRFDCSTRWWNVLSVARTVEEAPKGYSWVAIPEVIRRLASSQSLLLRSSLDQLAEYEFGEKAGAFARSGWLEELARWAAPALAAIRSQ